MIRGTLITVALPGDLGKPRPALIIQADRFERLATLTVLPITSTLVDAPLLRVTLEPSDTNGLRKRSQVMLDKISTIRRDKLGPRIGVLNRDQLIEIERRLAVFLGLAD